MFCSRFLQVLFSALPAARLADPQALLHRPAVCPAADSGSSSCPAHCDSGSGRVQHCRLRLAARISSFTQLLELEQSNSRTEQAIRRVTVYHTVSLDHYRSTLPPLLILVHIHVLFDRASQPSAICSRLTLSFRFRFRLRSGFRFVCLVWVCVNCVARDAAQYCIVLYLLWSFALIFSRPCALFSVYSSHGVYVCPAVLLV